MEIHFYYSIFTFLGYRIQLTDKNNRKAFAFIADKSVVNVLKQDMDDGEYIISYGDSNGASYWDGYILPQILSQSNITPGKERKLFLVRNAYGHLGIKYLPEKMRPREHHYLRYDIPDVAEVIIAEVFPDDPYFSVGTGCRLEVMDV